MRVAALIAFLIHLNDFAHKYSPLADRLTLLSDEIKSVQSNVARDATVISAIRAVLNSQDLVPDGESEALIKQVARRSLVSLFTVHYNRLAQELNNFSENQSTRARFNSARVAEQSTLELVERLPDHSIWCGTTRVVSNAWKGGALGAYLARSRARVNQGH